MLLGTFTSTGYVRASCRWTTPSEAPTALRTGYATCCGCVGERDAVGNLVRSSQACCSPHASPVGSRGIARTAMHASCLRRPRPALICEAHSLETCPLNHAPPAASTPLLTTSFCMEAGARRRRRRRPPRIPRPRGQPPPRRDPASSDLRPSPLRVARRGGLAYPVDQRLRSAEY